MSNPCRSCPPDRDDRAGERKLQRIAYLADAVQPHVNADGMDGFEMREPGVEGGEGGHRIKPVKAGQATGRPWRRPRLSRKWQRAAR